MSQQKEDWPPPGQEPLGALWGHYVPFGVVTICCEAHLCPFELGVIEFKAYLMKCESAEQTGGGGNS